MRTDCDQLSRRRLHGIVHGRFEPGDVGKLPHDALFVGQEIAVDRHAYGCQEILLVGKKEAGGGRLVRGYSHGKCCLG